MQYITECEVCQENICPRSVRKSESKYFLEQTEQTRLLRYLWHGFSFRSIKANKREKRKREICSITSRSCMGSYWTDFRPISVLDLVISPINLTCHVIECNITQHNTNTIQYNTTQLTQYNTAQHKNNITQHKHNTIHIIQYNTIHIIQYNTIQYNIIQYYQAKAS